MNRSLSADLPGDARQQRAIEEAHLDVTGAEVVEVAANEEGTVLWVNINGVCILRVCRIKVLWGFRSAPPNQGRDMNEHQGAADVPRLIEVRGPDGWVLMTTGKAPRPVVEGELRRDRLRAETFYKVVGGAPPKHSGSTGRVHVVTVTERGSVVGGTAPPAEYYPSVFDLEWTQGDES